MPEKPQRGEALPFTVRDLRHGIPSASGSDRRSPPATPRQMLEQGYEYHGYCGRCAEWRHVDLKRLVRIGQGDRPIAGRRLKCQHCGIQGSGQLKRVASRQ
jgi:hypothetical protein